MDMTTAIVTVRGALGGYWRILLILALLLPLAVAAGAAPPAADALCVTPQEQGNWANINPNTRSITRAQLRFVCQDQILNGQPYPPGPPWYVRLFGKCTPTDCDWGEVGATRQADGWIRATYTFGFKTSYVWLKTYAYNGRTYLRVYVDNRFAPGDGRANYVTDEWFLK
jgi:hypothetical protein